METPLDKSIVASEALRVASRELNITPPKLFLVEVEQLLGTIEWPSRIAGLADSATRSIYILADQSLAGIVRTVFHEVFHIYDRISDENEELRADAFIFRCCGSHTAKTGLVEILKALEGIGTGTLNKRSSSNAKPVSFLNTDAQQQQKKIAEIRATYYSKGIQARAELFLKPKNRGYFPADIEFHNTPFKKCVHR